jgi:uncharacterized protein (TIGR02271 family)
MVAAQQRSTVVGVFEDRHHADQAVSELMSAGCQRDQIGIAMRHDEDPDSRTEFVDADTEGSHAGEGAVAGALTGLGVGALAGLGVLAGMVPVIGPAIAGGTLGVILSNAAAGAGIAGLVGALVGAGVPQHEAEYYDKEFEAGRIIVTVAVDGRADEAMAILRRNGAYDMSTRGTVASDAITMTSQGFSTAASASSMPMTEGAVCPTDLETSTSGTSRSSGTASGTGRDTSTLDVPVEYEDIMVERAIVYGQPAPENISAGDFGKGKQIRVPVREDQINATKEAATTEEANANKAKQTGNVDVKTRGTGPGTNPF